MDLLLPVTLENPMLSWTGFATAYGFCTCYAVSKRYVNPGRTMRCRGWLWIDLLHFCDNALLRWRLRYYLPA